MSMKTIIAVILYNKVIDDSLTLKSLCDISNYDYDLVIINNGPVSLEFDGPTYKTLCLRDRNVSYIEHLDNIPLSLIYNDFLRRYIDGYERFIIFDDDSIIPNTFFDDLDKTYNSNIDLQLPIIYEKKTNSIYYPLVNGAVVDKKLNPELSVSDDVFSIGSGLTIYKSLIYKFDMLNLDVFDNRFALYGVDYSLFRRIRIAKKNNIKVGISITSYILHSLSKTESNMSAWRGLERGYDGVLSARYYSKSVFHLLYFVSKSILIELKSNRFRNVVKICFVLFRGKHPKC